MIERLIARQKRFWHCFSHTIRLDTGHCMLDVHYYDPDERKLTRAVACTCGKIFHSEGPHVSNAVRHIIRERDY